MNGINWVDIDDRPWHDEGDPYGPGQDFAPVLNDDARVLLAPMQDKILHLVEKDMDAAKCEAEDEQGNPCATMVGEAVRERDDDEYPATRAWMEWQPTTIVQCGDRVIAVCEAHSPTRIFPTLQETS